VCGKGQLCESRAQCVTVYSKTRQNSANHNKCIGENTYLNSTHTHTHTHTNSTAHHIFDIIGPAFNRNATDLSNNFI